MESDRNCAKWVLYKLYCFFLKIAQFIPEGIKERVENYLHIVMGIISTFVLQILYWLYMKFIPEGIRNMVETCLQIAIGMIIIFILYWVCMEIADIISKDTRDWVKRYLQIAMGMISPFVLQILYWLYMKFLPEGIRNRVETYLPIAMGIIITCITLYWLCIKIGQFIPEGIRNRVKKYLQTGSEVDGQLQSHTAGGHSVAHRDKHKRTPVIGIFSRKSKESYSWLTDHLTWEFDTKTFHLSNRGEWKQTEDFYECTHAILYQNSWWLTISYALDSLYDEDLQFLSTMLGKKNVIVVQDDLMDAGPEAKSIRLRNQPSIENLAAELFLFSVEEKQSLLNDGPITKKLAAMKLIFYGKFS
uniref:Uncharacterized protein n=1 Tax=Xenopus tropicalis TaxID=8364 RepID=A0A803JCZ4_XENTR